MSRCTGDFLEMCLPSCINFDIEGESVLLHSVSLWFYTGGTGVNPSAEGKGKKNSIAATI